MATLADGQIQQAEQQLKLEGLMVGITAAHYSWQEMYSKGQLQPYGSWQQKANQDLVNILL